MSWFCSCYYETKVNSVKLIICTAEPIGDKMIAFFVRGLKS